MSQAFHSFVAAGRAAQHCAQLTARGPGPAELRARWAALGAEAAENLAPLLAPLLGKEPAIAAAPADDLPHGLAAQALIAREGCPGLLHLTIDGAALLQAVDRAFGGMGLPPQSLPDQLPASALLLAQRIEALAITALAGALRCQPEALAIYHSARQVGALPARSSEAAAVLQLTVEEPGGPAWPIGLALPASALGAWFGSGPAISRTARAAAADPATAPFADIPLPLRATLVDMRVPLSLAASLEPGLVIPVAVARAVPLATGDRVIARGTVGSQDDRVALQLNQIA